MNNQESENQEREKNEWDNSELQPTESELKSGFEHHQEITKEMLNGVYNSGVFPVEMLELYD